MNAVSFLIIVVLKIKQRLREYLDFDITDTDSILKVIFFALKISATV